MHQAAVCAWLPVQRTELSAVAGLILSTTPPTHTHQPLLHTVHISAAACCSLPAVEHIQHGPVCVAMKLQLIGEEMNNMGVGRT